MPHYLGLCMLIDRDHTGLQIAPAVTAFGEIADEVVAATNMRFRQSLEYRIWDRLRFYVLALDEHSCRLTRVWVVAPAELVGRVVDHTTGEVAEVRVAETGSQPSPRDGSSKRTSMAAAEGTRVMLGPVSSPFGAPLYLGVRQVVQPEAGVSVQPPTVLAIGLDRAAVEVQTREQFTLRNRVTNLCTVHYWVLEHHRGVTVSVENLIAAPDDVRVVQHDEKTGDWRDAKSSELL